MIQPLRLPFLVSHSSVLVSRRQRDWRPTSPAFVPSWFSRIAQTTTSARPGRMRNGDLIASWYRGSGERSADDVRVIGARLRNGSREWSKDFLMADSPASRTATRA